MTSPPDVAVVGAGPAGLAAAIVLARQGLQVHLLDRQHLPADKVCGEGLMPPGLRFLDEIGVTPHLPLAETAPFSGIRYLTARGLTAQAEFAEGPGRGIRRTALSRALHQVAATLPTLTIRQGIRVTGLARDGELMRLLSDGDPPLHAHLVVAADGLRSQIRRWAGLAGPPSRRERFGIRQHFRHAPWSRFVEVHSGPGLEGYVTPCGPDRIGLAILWDRAQAPVTASGPDLFPALLAKLPALRERLATAEPLGTARATGPFAQRTTRRTADGLVLLGDASGYLDPCTGEGLTLAFRQARALAQCVVPALDHARSRGSIVSRSDLRDYEHAWRHIMRPYTLCTRAMLFCHRHPALHERLIATLAARPDLLRHFLSFNMGTAPLLPGLRRTAGWLLPRASPHAENP